MRKDQPRSFRLTTREIEALEWLAQETGKARGRIVGELLLEAAARRQAEDVRGRLDGIEERLRRLEKPGIILCGGETRDDA